MRRLDDDEWGLPEDDWFAEPPTAPRREPSEPELTEEPAQAAAPPTADEIQRRRRLALAGLAAAIVLVVAGILIARAIGGDDGEPAETVVTPPPPAATTPTPPPPPTPTPTPTPPSAPIVLPEGVRLAVGSEGEDVVAVQRALAQLGYEVGEADGVYGELTEAAVIAFQGAQGLTADGIVGAETLAALQTALNAG
jgi:hypothetical protein